jgi:tetratricopeptide (TPR) repeat protein
MNLPVITVLFLLTLNAGAQQMSLPKWEEEEKTNIRLLPKYGYKKKTEAQKNSDREFLETVLKKDSVPRSASDHLIALGFKYLQTDIKTAMYRFNQAWLVDSTNTNVYWGFGAVYMTLKDLKRAKEQYTAGLALDRTNTRLLTDYGTYFMMQYYLILPMNEQSALPHLDSALSYLGRSYALDARDQNTLFKLSVAYWNKGDCGNAWKYYRECELAGGTPITEEYTNDLKKKCGEKKKD